MSALTIDYADPDFVAKLEARAARNGRSAGEEARLILDLALETEAPRKPLYEESGASLYDEIRSRFEPFGFVDDLVIPPRGPAREPPTFD